MQNVKLDKITTLFVFLHGATAEQIEGFLLYIMQVQIWYILLLILPFLGREKKFLNAIVIILNKHHQLFTGAVYTSLKL